MSLETNYLSGPKNTITNEVINRISVISKTGTNIPTVPVSIGIPILRCIEDGLIYKINRAYILRADQSGYDPLFPMHTHDPNDEFNEGGSYYDIMSLNSSHLLDFNNLSFLREGFWIEADEAPATVVVNERLGGALYVKGTSNQVSTVNKSFNLFRGGQRIDFSYPLIFVIKMTLSHSTALVFRAGCNMTLVQNVDAGQNQVGIEGCTSGSSNFQLVSGNGSSRTGLELPSAALNYASFKGYKVEFFPGDKIVLTDGLGNSITKTDNKPTSSSSSDADATLRIGLVTSNNVSKIVKLAASRLLGKVFDTNPAIGGWV